MSERSSPAPYRPSGLRDDQTQHFQAVGEAAGPRAGLAALAELDPSLPRYVAVAAYLHERDGDPVTAARLYADAARAAPSLAERDHLTRQATRLHAQVRGLAV